MKKTLIIVGVVISILIMFACLFLVTKNKAIDLEEHSISNCICRGARKKEN